MVQVIEHASPKDLTLGVKSQRKVEIKPGVHSDKVEIQRTPTAVEKLKGNTIILYSCLAEILVDHHKGCLPHRHC